MTGSCRKHLLHLLIEAFIYSVRFYKNWRATLRAVIAGRISYICKIFTCVDIAFFLGWAVQHNLFWAKSIHQPYEISCFEKSRTYSIFYLVILVFYPVKENNTNLNLFESYSTVRENKFWFCLFRLIIIIMGFCCFYWFENLQN